MSRSANWIKQTVSGTPGTGTITLSTAETGFVGIGDQFGDGSYVRYFIEDGDDREEGSGVFASGAGTLTRVEIVATLVSGTLTKLPGTGISASSASIVTISASSDNSAGNGVPFLTNANSDDLPDSFAGFNDSIVNASANNLIFLPCCILFRRRINEFWIDVQTASASSDTRVGLWEQDANGEPGALLFGSGAIDVSTTGTKTAAPGAEIILEPGVYWLGFKSDSTTVATRGSQASSAQTSIQFGPGGGYEFDSRRRRFPSLAGVVGALTANLSPTAQVTISGGVGFNA